MSETYSTMNRASYLLDRLDHLRELYNDVKFSSLYVDREIEEKLDELQEIFESELRIMQQKILDLFVKAD